MNISVKILETLGAATKMLHWKGAKKILGQVTSELDFSGHSANDLMDSLNRATLIRSTVNLSSVKQCS
jgi:hypothetical protein